MASYYDAYDDGAEDALKNAEELAKIPEVQAKVLDLPEVKAKIEEEKAAAAAAAAAAAVAAKMATIDVVGDPAATSIGASAFGGCTGLTTANFPAATSIGASAFGGCSHLTTASFPAATNIGSNALYAANLTDLTLSSLTVDEVTLGVSGWGVPSGCVVHCKDGDYTVP